MESLFLQSSLLTSEEFESITFRLRKIIEQIETIIIADNQCPSTPYSLIPSKSTAGNAFDKLKLRSTHTQEVIDVIKKKDMFEGDVQDSRMTS